MMQKWLKNVCKMEALFIKALDKILILKVRSRYFGRKRNCFFFGGLEHK